MAATRGPRNHAQVAKAKKLSRKDDKAARFRRGKRPAVEQFPSAFPAAPADAAGIARTLSRGL